MRTLRAPSNVPEGGRDGGAGRRYTYIVADTVPVDEAGPRLSALVRRAAVGRERITLTDEDRSAVLISAQELADLEDGAALASFRVRRADGHSTLVSQADARARLLGE